MSSLGLRRAGFSWRTETALFSPEAEVCTDGEEVFQPFFLCEPPMQVRFFIQLFCLSVALGLVVNHAGAVRFYRLLLQSKVPAEQRRGLGYTACKAYGVFPIPKLAESQFQAVGWLLVATLLLACHTHLAPRFFLFASFGLYFLYFGQLFCESKHGGHGAVLMPSVLLLLALSGGPQGSPWSLVFIKIFLGIIYLAGAVSKVFVSGLFRRRWCGSTMQAYLYDALWSRPHRNPLVRRGQQMLLTRWWACSGMALSGLIFEFGWLPLVLLGGPVGGTLGALVAFAFHTGVEVLQGLDFLPFWCPVFWVFLPDLQVLLNGQPLTPQETWTSVLAQGFGEEPCRWVMSALYIGLQIAVFLRFQDLRGKDCLPLTCCPMFAVPRNLFSREIRGGILADMDLRNGGHIDVAYNFYPWLQDLPLAEEDLKQIPGRVLFWMSTTHVHPLLTRMIRPECIGQELLVCANFDVSPELRKQLANHVSYLDRAQETDWADPAKVREVLDLQQHCRALFEAHPPRVDDVSEFDLLNCKGKMDACDFLWQALGLLSPSTSHPYVA